MAEGANIHPFRSLNEKHRKRKNGKKGKYTKLICKQNRIHILPQSFPPWYLMSWPWFSVIEPVLILSWPTYPGWRDNLPEMEWGFTHHWHLQFQQTPGTYTYEKKHTINRSLYVPGLFFWRVFLDTSQPHIFLENQYLKISTLLKVPIYSRLRPSHDGFFRASSQDRDAEADEKLPTIKVGFV